MGIQDFYGVLEEECPEVLINTRLEQLAGSSLAIDISIFLYKYVRTAGPDGWMDLFLLLLCTLKKYGMKAVCIFDGPNPPIEKKKEQDARRATVEKTRQKMKMAKRMKKVVDEKHIPDDKPLSSDLEKEIRGILAGRKKDVTNYSDVYDVSLSLGNAIARWERQTLPITDDYRIQATEMVEAMGLAHFRAEGEAETLCAYLCIHGYVDAVLSEDTDVLAYGTPVLLSKFDAPSETVTYLSQENILNCLNLEYKSFLDMCILLSCDYNDRAKGFPVDGKKRKKPVSIGAKSVYPLISKFKTIENARKSSALTDVTKLKYKRCRELFTIPNRVQNIVIPFTTEIKKNKLEELLKRHRCRIKATYIYDHWKPMKMIFEEGVEDVLERELEEMDRDDENTDDAESDALPKDEDDSVNSDDA